MAEKLLFVYNPHSGTNNYSSRISSIINVFVEEGFRVEVYPTQGRGDARRRIRELEPEFSRVVIAGGDGTLNEAVRGLLDGKHDIALGYIPMGSTNDFSVSLGIKRGILNAAREAVTGREVLLDVGRYEDDHFVYIAAFGAFTSVAYETNQKLKNAFGHAAYLMTSIKSFADIKPYRMTIECNGEERTQEYIYGMITNSKSVGGMKNITGKYVELSDGLLEVTLIKNPKNVLDLAEIVAKLVDGTLDSELIESFQTDSIKIKTRHSIPWTIDGEYGGEHKSVHIQIEKLALKMIV